MASPTLPGKDVGVGDVYRAYEAFCASAARAGEANLAHCLVLVEPLSTAGEAPLMAASIASAASLCIEADGDAVRKGIRSGAIDFTVNNLDEALRALKNEVRKGASIAVCLEGTRDTVLNEMVERGVQPDFVCGEGPEEFFRRGARRVESSAGKELVATGWTVAGLPGKWLPLVDEIVAGVLPESDVVRRSWLQRAPRYVRALRTERCLPLRADEYALVLSGVRAAGLAVAVNFEFGGRVETIVAG